MHVVTGTRPSELGDDNALAGIGLAQFVVDDHGLVDCLRLRESLPVGKNVRGNIVDSGNKFWMLDPDVPDFTGGHRNVRRALYALDHLNQIADFLLIAIDRLIANDDTVAVAVTLRKLYHRTDFALVAILIFVDPGARGDAESGLGRDARHELDSAGRRVRTNCTGVGCEKFQVGTNLRRLRGCAVRMLGAFERRVGNTRELPFK